MNKAKLTSKLETRQLLLDTTLQLIETEGIKQVTIRKIAARAGVNLAAVNYHFGSKEQVIFAALQTLRSGFAEAFKQLQNLSLAPRDRLVVFMTSYCDTVFDYPNLVRAFVTHTLNADFEQDYADFVRAEGLTLITRTLAEFLPDNNETLRMKAFQMMSSLLLILLVGQETGAIIGLNFVDPEVRARYIQNVVPAISR
jgi:AcrR family transcriptional regulator